MTKIQKCKSFIIKILPLLIIILLIFFLFGKTLFPPKGKIIYGGDLNDQFYFWKGYLAESLKKGFIPFWNPYNFSGTPFLAHPSTSFFYPFTIIFYLLPLNIAFSWHFALHLFIGALGMYLLCRVYTDKLSGIIAAGVFILSGYFATRVYAGHADLVRTAVWIPFVIFSIKRLLESPSKKATIQAIVFLSLQILAGYQAYVVFTLEFIFAYTIYYFISNRSSFSWKSIRQRLIFLLLTIILSLSITSVQWLPTWQFTRHSIRGEGLPYELASWGSLPISGLKLFFKPLDRVELNKITFNLGGGPLPNPFDHFVGVLPLLIIIIFIVSKIITSKTHPDFWFFLFMVFIYIIISLGYNFSPNLHYLLYKVIPVYQYIRIPIQHLVFLVVLVPVMFGIVLKKVRINWVKVLIFAVCVWELFAFGRKYIFLTNSPEKNYDLNLIEFFKTNVRYERLLPAFGVVSPVRKALDLNAVMKYQIPTTSGYDPVILRNFYRFIDVANKSLDSSLLYYNVEVPPIKLQEKTLNFLNVRYILVDKSNKSFENSDDFRYRFVFENSQAKLYENMDYAPRFFLVNKAYFYDSKQKLEKAIVDKSPDFSKEVLFLKKDLVNFEKLNLSCEREEIGEVNIVSYSPNKILLKVKSYCNGFLSSSEVYYPGWKVKIDNQETDIIQSNRAFRTIYMPKGTHEVILYYSPEIYYLGAGISFISLLFLASIFIYPNKRRPLFT